MILFFEPNVKPHLLRIPFANSSRIMNSSSFQHETKLTLYNILFKLGMNSFFSGFKFSASTSENIFKAYIRLGHHKRMWPLTLNLLVSFKIWYNHSRCFLTQIWIVFFKSLRIFVKNFQNVFFLSFSEQIKSNSG